MTPTKRDTPVFDPRKVPVVQAFHSLPVVPAEELQPDALRLRFRRAAAWQPELRAEPKFSEREPAHASVLIPIVMRECPTVLLTQRTPHLSSHSGQIAFPGGKADADDADAIATALREAEEEVGLRSSAIEVLGSMPHYTTGSAFIVTPVVALLPATIQPEPNADEVAHVFEVPLSYLMNPKHHRLHRIEWEGAVREWYSMPYKEGSKEWFIWGATAGMLRNLYRFLLA